LSSALSICNLNPKKIK